MMNRFKQQGSVLIISLVLLLVLTILGISGMDNTIMEEKMAGNLYQSNIAFQNAETALRYAEADLMSLSKSEKIIGTDSGDKGVWNGAYGSRWMIDDWGVSDWRDNSKISSSPGAANRGSLAGGDPGTATAFPYPNAVANGDEVAFYIIEELSPICDALSVGQQQDMQSCTDQYQITAMGLGPGERLRSYVRSTLLRRY